MKQELYFDFRDVFRFPRIALSGKKIWTFFLANVVGFIGFVVLSYIAILVSGHGFSSAWTSYHFFPFPYDIGLTTIGWIIYCLGSLVWGLAYYFANLAVVRITYKEFKGDFFFSSGDGWQFVKKHWHPLIFAPLAVIGVVLFFLIMAVIAALLGKIPYIGEFIYSLPYLIYFPVAVFVIYTVVIFGVVLTFTPAIVGTSEEDTLEAVFQSYSLLWSQPWRLVVYEGIWSVLGTIAIYIFGLVMAAGVAFITFVFGMNWLMGDKALRILDAGLSYLGGDSSVYHEFLNLFTTPFLGEAMSVTALNGTEMVAAAFLAIGLFVIMVVIFSYACALDSVGQTLIYLVLRKKKDDENLLERKDEDELEEEEEELDLPGEEGEDILDDEEERSPSESDEEESSPDPDEESEDQPGDEPESPR